MKFTFVPESQQIGAGEERFAQLDTRAGEDVRLMAKRIEELESERLGLQAELAGAKQL